MPLNHTKGFTLIETLVALFILTVGLIPILVVGFSSKRVAEVIEHNLLAANLAQEGVEVIRAVRDTNWIANASFDTGLNGGDYEVEWNSSTLTPYGDRFLTLSPQGIYKYSESEVTLFKRRVSLTKVSSVELKVITTVYWEERGASKTFEVEDHLFDWH